MNQSAVSLSIPWEGYYELTKPNVVLLIVFTAMVGMVLASPPGEVSVSAIVFGSIGIGLSAACAAVINHLVDQKIDIHMQRTQKRPLVTGHINSVQAGIFALVLGSVSMFILTSWVNVMTALLTFGSLIGYGVIYSMYLKYVTPQNIVIGGAAGAAPPVLGWTAVTGEVHPHALLLFLIIFVWTPPHFWSLAIAKKHEYEQARLPVLPVTHGEALTRLHVVLYSVLLLGVSLLPFAVRMSGWLYFIGALLLGFLFLYQAIQIMRYPDNKEQAMQLFSYSIAYLAILFTLLLVDHYVAYVVQRFGLV